MKSLSVEYVQTLKLPMNIEPLSSHEVLTVLSGCDLPVADISISSSAQFFGYRVADTVVAVIGLELLQSVGLLRSLAVIPTYRMQGLAHELVNYAESFAASHGIESLFLLTTTVEDFFIKLGYRPTPRQNAPEAIQGTAQFSSLCPSSSSFLSKHLRESE
jgi:amino-acid N-acetyltransferase